MEFRITPMYVCVCNAIKNSEIQDLANRGVRRAADVYAALEVNRNCANCAEYVQEALDDCRSEHTQNAEQRASTSA